LLFVYGAILLFCIREWYTRRIVYMDKIIATLYAIFDLSGEPIENTVLCPMCYTDKNIDWINLNYKNPDWRNFDIEVEHKKS